MQLPLGSSNNNNSDSTAQIEWLTETERVCAGKRLAKQAPQQQATKFISPHNLTTFRRNNHRATVQHRTAAQAKDYGTMAATASSGFQLRLSALGFSV